MEEDTQEKGIVGKLKNTYKRNTTLWLVIPNLILLIALLQIGLQFSQTGEILQRGVSLKGGFTVTVPTEKIWDAAALENEISKEIGHDVSIRKLSSTGTHLGYIVESSISPEKKENIDILLQAIERAFGVKKEEYSVEVIGSSLGSTFFKQALRAMLLAFIFMSIVVAIYFRTFVPSIAVILAVFSDIVITMAVTNMMGLRISTAGIAAFLMLIGYSVDTDILLTSRVIRRQEGSVLDRIYGAFKTGSTLTLTTLAAAGAGFIFSQSEVIKQIMLIILIGLVVDFIVTWLQNATILRMYMRKKTG